MFSHRERDRSDKKSPMSLDGAVVRMPSARHVPAMFCRLIRSGRRLDFLLNQLLGLEEATQVEDLPGG